MRAVLAFAFVACLCFGVSHSIQEKPRQLRKDYYYNHHHGSSKSSKGSSKSGKSSSKSSKSGSSSDGYYASSKSGKSTGKSSKGSSKSGKSSHHSSSYITGAYDKFEGDSKATKYESDDDYVLDLNADDRLTNNGVSLDDVVEDDMAHDDFDDDVDYYDDVPLEADGDAHGDVVESDVDDTEEVEETIESLSGPTDANVSEEADGSLEQNSWLTDLIEGNESTDDDKADDDDSSAHEDDKDFTNSETALESHSSMSLKLENDNASTHADAFASTFTGDNAAENEDVVNADFTLELESSMSLNLKDDLEQNSWLTDLISGDETTNDDDNMSMGMKEGESSMSIDFKDDLEQNSWLTDLISGDETTDDDDNMSMGMKDESSMAFEEFASYSDLVSSMSMGMFDEKIELEQAELDFGNMSEVGGSSSDDSTSNGIEVSEKNTDNDLNTGAEDASGSNISVDDNSSSTTDNSTGQNTADTDDGSVDDGVIDDSTESTSIVGSNLNYLTQDERTEIILEKCNTTPLDRALSMIQIIGNHVDPEGKKIFHLQYNINYFTSNSCYNLFST